ncbi:MAG: hypothetical protein HZB39_21120 [Planctomycetes bacterium]|nr:hypothetical protein [Planctomycetota bacterium]
MRIAATLHAAATLGALAVASYLLGLPLLRERARRGDFLWGHYGWHELWIGVPALVVALVLTALWLVPRARRLRAAARALLATVATLIAVAGFDLVFALVVRGALHPDYWLDLGHITRADNLPDQELGFVRKPHATWRGLVPGTDRIVEYAADENGFRNPPGRVSAEIAFVGDSYTEAAQIERERIFAELVGQRLGKSIVNLGRGAYGPQQEAIVIGRYALPGKPKLVVWQLFDGNDLRDAEQFASWSLGERAEVPLAERYFANSLFHPLIDATRRERRGEFATLRFDDGHLERLAVRYRWQPHQSSERPTGLRATERALREGVAKCAAADVDVVIVFMPIATRILRERLDFLRQEDAASYAPPDDGGIDDFAAALHALCKEMEVPLIDLTPVFLRAVQERADGIYIPRDEHLDLRGHELVADTICSWITSRG